MTFLRYFGINKLYKQTKKVKINENNRMQLALFVITVDFIVNKNGRNYLKRDLITIPLTVDYILHITL